MKRQRSAILAACLGLCAFSPVLFAASTVTVGGGLTVLVLLVAAASAYLPLASVPLLDRRLAQGGAGAAVACVAVGRAGACAQGRRSIRPSTLATRIVRPGDGDDGLHGRRVHDQVDPEQGRPLSRQSECDQSEQEEGRRRQRGAGERVRQLGAYVIDMVGGRSHGGHYRGVADRRGVIAENRP